MPVYWIWFAQLKNISLWAKQQLLNQFCDPEELYLADEKALKDLPAEVVEALALHWPGFRSEMDKAGQAGMKECTLLKLCCDKALAHLGWKATLTFEETIRFTAEWYHRFYRGDGAKQGSMLDFSLGQIAAYVNAAEQREQLWTK